MHKLTQDEINIIVDLVKNGASEDQIPSFMRSSNQNADKLTQEEIDSLVGVARNLPAQSLNEYAKKQSKGFNIKELLDGLG